MERRRGALKLKNELDLVHVVSRMRQFKAFMRLFLNKQQLSLLKLGKSFLIEKQHSISEEEALPAAHSHSSKERASYKGALEAEMKDIKRHARKQQQNLSEVADLRIKTFVEDRNRTQQLNQADFKQEFTNMSFDHSQPSSSRVALNRIESPTFNQVAQPVT